MKLIYLLSALTLIAPSFSQATDWAMDRDKSELSFTATQSGAEFIGTFENFDAAISLDPSDLANASIAVTVDMSSVNTNAADRDQQLPSSAWFDTGQFATAVFESNDIKEVASGSYEAAGSLTIKGIAQQVVLPFSLSIDGSSASAQGELALNRLDYEIGSGNWANESMVGFPVKVSFSLEATAK